MSVSASATIVIEKATPSLERDSFGTLMVVGYHTRWPNRVKEYSTRDLQPLLDDGFVVTDPIYRAAQAIASQQPKPSTFKVGRRALAPTQGHVLTVTAKNSTLYSVVLNGTTFSFTSDATATAAEITAGLTAAINGGSEPVTATDNMDGTVTLAADVAGALYTLEVADNALENLIEVENTTTDPGIATDLAAIEAEDGGWYGFVLDSDGRAEIEAAAAWAEARVKLFGAVTRDSEVLDVAVTNDVMSTLQDSALERTHISWHHRPHEYMAAAWMSEMFARTPGSATWAFKTLANVQVTPATLLGIGAQNVVEGKGGNYYARYKSRNVTWEGRTPSAEWIDTTRGLDDTQAQLEAADFAYKADNAKVPFTQAGADGLAANLEAVLRRKEVDGFLVLDSSSVTAPDVNDTDLVSSADKLARTLRNITGQAQFAGAVHKTNLNIRIAP